MSRDIGCVPKRLPEHLRPEAARTAIAINPANRPRLRGLLAEGLIEPQHIALMTSKYWGKGGVKLSVSFLDTTNTTLINKILAYANKWGNWANVSFAYTASKTGAVRVSLGPGGYWSYLGTDITHIPAGQQTMNLEAFSMSEPDSEFDRVVCHEFGHTCGFPHEHERAEAIALLDKAKTETWFLQNVGWDKQTTDEQVFTPLDPADITQHTPLDVRSIMCYQFPGACTKSGQPIPGGDVIDDSDGTFAAGIYPKVVAPPPPPPPGPTGGGTRELQLSLKLLLTDPHALALEAGTYTLTAKG